MKFDKKAFDAGLKRIVAARLNDGFNQRAIANFFGISESMLQYYMRGKRQLSIGRQLLIADTINLTYQQIIDYPK